MKTLYRMNYLLPSLLMAVVVAGCEEPPPPQQTTERPTNVYVEALKEAEAAKQSVEARNTQEQRIDALLGRGETPSQ